MRFFSRNGVYHVEFAGGKRRSLKTSDYETAKGIFHALEKEYLKGRLLRLDTVKRISLSQFAREYEATRPGISKWTIKKDALTLKLFREAIGDCDIRTITSAKIDQFANVCLTRGAKPVTVNGYLRHLKAALSYAADNELIPKRPKVKMVKVNRESVAERILSPETLQNIIKTATPDFGRYLTVLLWTGGRRREILGLTWQAIDFTRKSVLLTQTKGHKDRRVPLLPEAISALEPIKKDIGRVFPNWHPDTASKWFHALALQCGAEARLHDLRHSCAFYLLKSGVPIQVVKEILGHANLSTTMIYSHVVDDLLTAEMAKMKIQ
jgi:integrase